MNRRISIMVIVAINFLLVGFWITSALPVFAANRSYPADNLQTRSELNALPGQNAIYSYFEGETNGNMGFMSQNGESVEIVIWDNQMQNWYSITLSGKATELVESNGHFCGHVKSGRKNQMTTWNKYTKNFISVIEYSDSVKLLANDGNFAFYSSDQRTAIWTPQTSRWKDIQIPGEIVKTAGRDDPKPLVSQDLEER